MRQLPRGDVLILDPLAVAELTRQSLKERPDQKLRSSLGQFFTPPIVARLMASMSSVAQGSLRLVDAGAGAGALAAAWGADICSREEPSLLLPGRASRP